MGVPVDDKVTFKDAKRQRMCGCRERGKWNDGNKLVLTDITRGRHRSNE